MEIKVCIGAGLLAVLFSGVAVWATSPARLVNPMQPWTSPTGDIHFLRPIEASMDLHQPAASIVPQGWRFDWTSRSPVPGDLLVRLTIKTRPATNPFKTQVEGLQIGSSSVPAAVRDCLLYGLNGGSSRHLPDRVINGQRYATWTNGDSAMSQSIVATDLRTVVEGRCYAVERFTFSESASDGGTSLGTSAAQGALRMDAVLSSLQLGSVNAEQIIKPTAIP